MKKYFILLLLCSCSTYVPLEYRVPGEFSATKGSYVGIAITKEADLAPTAIQNLQEQIGSEINRDGWLKYKKERGPKKAYEIVIKQFKTEINPGSSSVDTSDNKRVRTSNYKTLGLADFSIKKVTEPTPVDFTIKIEDTVSSKVDLPVPLANGMTPVFETLLGYNRDADIIQSQDTALAITAAEDIRNKLIAAIRAKITPVKKTTQIEIEDDKDDMDAFKHLVKEQDYSGAIIYLNSLDETQKRSDIYYNTGVMYEIQNRFEEACPFYQLAHDLSPKTLYLEEKAGCESRLQSYNLLPF